MSPTHSPTPAYLASTLGKSVLAPVPAAPGTPVCLYFDRAPRDSHWDIFSVDQRRLVRLDFGAEVRQCWDSTGYANGVYYIKVRVDNVDGSQETWVQKAMLVKP